ncbi:winged helix-turn-helix transcriptional regulator [uncultured Robinsoniella sp.]|uniref:winged helix-turn-helix transcriptional regulator n=1 Tax=uncultured Robinsoniella sp. TaxID=904190 RepID=UPI00374ED496
MNDKYDAKKFCPITVTQNLLMGKWKLTILWIVAQKTRRFGELQRLIPEVSRGVLTQQLRELERDKLIHREVYKEVPPKVEYSITEIGKSFIPVMKNIMEWGVSYIKETTSCDMEMCVENNFACSKCYNLINDVDPITKNKE